MIDIRHLRYFVAVSEELHFGHAAERLHITQPPLSYAIRKLEADLGAELLMRTSRGVKLTEAGRIFAEEARQVIASFDSAVRNARRNGAVMTNVPLRVGCIPHFPLATLQRLLATLRHIAPDLTIEVSELLTVDQVRRLRDGLLDVGLFVRAEEFSDLEVQPVFPGLALAAFVSPNDPLAAKRVLTPDDLRAETLVTFPRSTNPPLFDMMLDRIEAQGYTFARLREATGPAPRDLFFEARAGAGVLISLGSLADSSELDGLLVARPLDPPVTTAETVLVHHADGTERMNALGRTLERTVSELRSTEGTNGRYVTGGDGAREEDSPTT